MHGERGGEQYKGNRRQSISLKVDRPNSWGLNRTKKKGHSIVQK